MRASRRHWLRPIADACCFIAAEARAGPKRYAPCAKRADEMMARPIATTRDGWKGGAHGARNSGDAASAGSIDATWKSQAVDAAASPRAEKNDTDVWRWPR